MERPVERCLETEARTPAEFGMRVAGIEFQVASLVNPGSIVADPRRSGPPETDKPVSDAFDGPCVVVAGTKVKSGGRPGCFRQGGVRKSDVALKRLEHMLPGSYCFRAANEDRISRFKTANEVRHQTIFGPVARRRSRCRARAG